MQVASLLDYSYLTHVEDSGKMSHRELVLAIFSDILGGKVRTVSPEEESLVKSHETSISEIFEQSYNRFSDDDHTAEREFSIFVNLTGKTLTLKVSSLNTIQDIKEMIEIKEGFPAHTFRLRSHCKELDDSLSVGSAGIQEDQTLLALPRVKGGACAFVEQVHSDVFTLSSLDLASGFDYDFTHRCDNGKKYVRGGHEYQRPYGWFRNALSVVGKYESDAWLGSNGIRTASTRGEWPVAYHGTKRSHNHAVIGKIFHEGFKAGRGKLHGRGIYASPSLMMVAEVYANKFTHKDGKTYQYAFQTRVNPSKMKIIEKGHGDADYWLLPDDSSAVRPYGFLTREMK